MRKQSRTSTCPVSSYKTRGAFGYRPASCAWVVSPLLLALLACRPGGTPAGEVTEPSTAPTPAPSTAPAPTPTTEPTTPEPTPTAPSAALPVVPMDLVVEEPGEAPRTVLSLREDGTLENPEGGDVARIEGSSLLMGEGELRINTTLEGGVIQSQSGQSRDFTFSPEGDVVLSNCRGQVDVECRIRVEDSGMLVLLEEGKEPERPPLRFEGFRPEARRTAVTIAALLLLTQPTDAPSGPQGSVTPDPAPEAP